MTIVGLLPPMVEGGELLVDGGYMNNLPVDVMRSMGVDTVIVVDVEGKDDTGWRNLQPYDGGVSGWRLLWDRVCPVPSWRYGTVLPRYASIINQLTWMTHAHNLRRVSEDYRIDLYLRPPNIASYKLMDFHLMERIVRDSYKYAALTVSKWPMLASVATVPGAGGAASHRKGARPYQAAAVAAAAAAATLPVTTPATFVPQYAPPLPQPPPPPPRISGSPVLQGPITLGEGAMSPTSPTGGVGGGAAHPTSSIMCMSQLQMKQQQEAAAAGGVGVAGRSGSPGPGVLTASSATAPTTSASALAAGILARVSGQSRRQPNHSRHLSDSRAPLSVSQLPGGRVQLSGGGGQAVQQAPPQQQAHLVRWGGAAPAQKQPQGQGLGGAPHPALKSSGQAAGTPQKSAPTQASTASAQKVMQAQAQPVRSVQAQGPPSDGRGYGSSSGGLSGGGNRQQPLLQPQAIGISGGSVPPAPIDPLPAPASPPPAITPSRPLSKMNKVKTQHSLLDLAAAAGASMDD